MDYIAHIRKSDHEIQTVERHLTEVQQLAEAFGAKIGVRHIAGLAGLLHDMGKFTGEFRTYIWNAVFHPELPSRRGSVDHSTAGGKLIYSELHLGKRSANTWILAELVANAVISHHSYLHDFLGPPHQSDFLARVEKDPREYEQAVELFYERVMNKEVFARYVNEAAAELEAYLNKDPDNKITNLMFLGKYIFSALVDADRTNSREFEEAVGPKLQTEVKSLFLQYERNLGIKLQQLQEINQNKGSVSIQELRKRMSDRCEQFASVDPGIYTLSIPTGGGKTFASFRYALRHAIEKNKTRIIYIVPYTTIIEQNAQEIRDIIQDDEHLLEHHSNVVDDASDNDEEDDGYMNTAQKLKHAKDNWDCPVIFTTMVQFLNVFYAKGGRNIRRLHNLSNAVIIVDEVQKVPVSCVSLFNQAVNFLRDCGDSTIILCSATQPALQFVEHKLDIQADAEMIEEIEDVICAFKRVDIVDMATEEIYDQSMLERFALDKLDEVDNVLIILNTKSVVRKLYRALSESANVFVYHLSTSMCARHRKDILNSVRGHLDRQEKVICISTQLIEAGVDISFDCVIRSLAELDSVAQAAGRCNRHGRDELRQVYVINYGEENLKHLKEIAVGKEISRKMFIDLKQDPSLFGGHILSVAAMEHFFIRYYKQLASSLNYNVPKIDKDMVELLTVPRKQNKYLAAYYQEREEELNLYCLHSYGTAADHFEVIKNQTTSVIVPYNDEARELIADLNGDGTIEQFSQWLRKAQQYTVNLWEHEKRELNANKGIESLQDGKVLVLLESAYDGRFGFDVGNDGSFGDLIM
ncbi:CRISPR-associated helicase Cas3' [Paenibacillus sp. 1011MAR3C5]|uniref:CRISPR-associated helicase Cas3' n=1 Tax=Paenibacillus sp. 1011MAR3C5 TaxID=1675787 RepID=UPI000E6C4077|nr:CRISPR-associated helicase Cas3' [Paenibacillus sp. 1011MAR3C5]RJE85192.1 CRISPR-associated helicase Cas3' [Paenibacillus sp. 1011MAR3C5]